MDGLSTIELEQVQLMSAVRATTSEGLARALSALLRSCIRRYGEANRALITDLSGQMIAACGEGASQWSVGDELLGGAEVQVALRKRTAFGASNTWASLTVLLNKKQPVGVLALSGPGGQLDREGLAEKLSMLGAMLGALLGEHHLVEHNAALSTLIPDDELTGLPLLYGATVPEEGWAAAVDLRELRHYNDKHGEKAGDDAVMGLVEAFKAAAQRIAQEDHRDPPAMFRGEGGTIVLVSTCPDGLYLTRIALEAKALFATHSSGLLFLAGIARLDEDGAVRAQRTLGYNKAATYTAKESRVVPIL